MSQPRVDLPDSVTPFLAEAVLAMTFDNDHDVVRWFDLLDVVHREQEATGSLDWTVVRERIAVLAAEATFDGAGVGYFLDVVEGGGQVATVADLAALRDLMPDTYWAVYWWRYGEEVETAGETSEPMAWVSVTASSRLAAAWGDAWREGLAAHLAARWGADWDQHPAEHKTSWLDDLLPELLGEDVVTAATADATDAGVAKNDAGELDEAALREIAVASVAESIAETPAAQRLPPEVVEHMVERVLAELRTA